MELCAGSDSRPSIIACIDNCGGSHPVAVGGWNDTNNIDDIAYGPGCSGALHNRGTNAGRTYFCAKANPSPFRLCIDTCGNGYGQVLGGWRDTNNISDIAYGPGYTGALQDRGTNAPITQLCGRGP